MKKVIYNYQFKNDLPEVAELFIDGAIVDAETQELYKEFLNEGTSVSFKSIRNQIETANPKTLNVVINSPGGQVYEAMAIHDYFEELKAKGVTVNTKGIGLVASAATYPLMSGTEVSMTENSHFMIHNVSGGIDGNVNEVETYAKTLRKINNNIRDYYSNKTGLPTETISAMMNKETFMTATEAKEKGFIDKVIAPQRFSNYIEPSQWLYKDVAVLNAYNSHVTSNNKSMIDKIVEGVTNALKNLGIVKVEGTPNNAVQPISNEALTAALTEALKPVNEQVQTLVNAAVEKKVKEQEGTLSETITTAVANALKPLQDELEAVKSDVANKAGQANPKPSNAAPSKYEHAGITWN